MADTDQAAAARVEPDGDAMESAMRANWRGDDASAACQARPSVSGRVATAVAEERVGAESAPGATAARLTATLLAMCTLNA